MVFPVFLFFIGQKGVLSGWESSRKEEISELETVPGEMSPVPSIYMNIDFWVIGSNSPGTLVMSLCFVFLLGDLGQVN